MGNGASPQRVALEFGWDKLPSPRSAGPGRAGQRRAERGSERPGGAAAHRERGTGPRDGEGAQRASRGMERLSPTFPGRGASSGISAEREKKLWEKACMCGCVWMLYSRSWKLSPPRLPPPRRDSEEEAPPCPGVSGGVRGLRGCPGAPGLGGRCGSGAEGVRGDTNGKRYGRKRPSVWDINQAEYMGS